MFVETYEMTQEKSRMTIELREALIELERLLGEDETARFGTSHQ
jgi:hypothetical protein